MAERKRIIPEGDPSASQKRQAFGRKARETINRRATTKKEGAERDNTRVRASWADLDAKIAVNDRESAELTTRFSPDLPEFQATFITSELERLGAEREELQRTRDSQILKEGSIEPLNEKEHADVLGSVEHDLEREVAGEERLESFLDICRSEDGKRWNNPRLNELGSIIDRIYLGAGTTERRILEMCIHQPDALPEALRKEAEEVMDALIHAEAEKMADATAFQVAGLRDRFRKAAIQSLKDDPKKREEILEASFVQTDRKPVLSLANPDAAMIAIREAVLTKGVLRSGESGDGWGRDSVEFLMAMCAAENKTFRTDEPESVQTFLALSGAIPKSRMVKLGIDEQALRRLQSERHEYGPSTQRSKEAVEKTAQEIAAARVKFDKVQEVVKSADAHKAIDWKVRAEQEYSKAVETEAVRLRADIAQREARVAELGRAVSERKDIIATSKQKIELAAEGFRGLTDFATEAARDLDGEVSRAMSRVLHISNPSEGWREGTMNMFDLLQRSASAAEQVITQSPVRSSMESADREIARLKQQADAGIGRLESDLTEAAKAFPAKPYSDDGVVRRGSIQKRVQQKLGVFSEEKRPLNEQVGGSYVLQEMRRRAGERAEEAVRSDRERLQQAVDALKAEVLVGQQVYGEVQALRTTLRDEIKPIVKKALELAEEEKRKHVADVRAAEVEIRSIEAAKWPFGKEAKIAAATTRKRAAEEEADKVAKDKIAWLEARDKSVGNW